MLLFFPTASFSTLFILIVLPRAPSTARSMRGKRHRHFIFASPQGIFYFWKNLIVHWFVTSLLFLCRGSADSSPFPGNNPAQSEVAHETVLTAAAKTAPDDTTGKLGRFFLRAMTDSFGMVFISFPFLDLLSFLLHRNAELHEFLPGELRIFFLRNDARAERESDRRLFRLDLGRLRRIVMDAYREDAVRVDRCPVDSPKFTHPRYHVL